MPEIEIGLRAVVQHINFAVLKRAHRSRIDIEIGIEFLENNAQPAQFKQGAERSRGQTFAKRTNHTASDKNIFHRGPSIFAAAVLRAMLSVCAASRLRLQHLPACRRRANHV